ncbi:hypothetical protein AX15_004886 [Amanita polypyramis BW_CC]|nr:hypothetical protein AX15_004886 [Amanita polypyramis BW_CC]
MTVLFNDIITSGIWPGEFKIADMVVMPKPNKLHYETPKDFRPIALLDCVGKLISKISAERLQEDTVKHDLLHTLQFGGVKQWSTTDTGVFLTEWAKQARDKNLFTSVLALDMLQCFPSLNHDATQISFVIFSFPTSKIAKQHIHGGNKFPLYDIPLVSQWDPLSPILSSLYVTLAMSVYFPFDPGKKDITMAYIDDYTLVTAGKTIEDNIKMLTSRYGAFCNFSEGLGLMIKLESSISIGQPEKHTMSLLCSPPFI